MNSEIPRLLAILTETIQSAGPRTVYDDEPAMALWLDLLVVEARRQTEEKTMDPNVALRVLEEILKDGCDRDGNAPDDSDEFNNVLDGLRTWLQRGGFEPNWKKGPLTAELFGKKVLA